MLEKDLDLGEKKFLKIDSEEIIDRFYLFKI